MNSYETVLILTPVLSEADVKKTISGYVDLMKSEGSEIVHEEHTGLKNLAYPIKKKTTGIYHVIEHTSPGPVIDKLEIAFRRNENVIRFLTIKLDKFGVEYNDKKRKGLIGKKKTVEPTEA